LADPCGDSQGWTASPQNELTRHNRSIRG
jgi:hypothetical protein